MQKRQIKQGDVFTYGVDKLVIYELPNQQCKSEWQLFKYNHYTKTHMSSCSNTGFVHQTEFNNWIETGMVKFEYNLFELMVVDLYLI